LFDFDIVPPLVERMTYDVHAIAACTRMAAGYFGYQFQEAPSMVVVDGQEPGMQQEAEVEGMHAEEDWILPLLP
jgi:hypothetical protein